MHLTSYLVWCYIEIYPLNSCITHWGREMHICISKLSIIGSDNGLSPGWCQTIIWSNAGILSIGPIGTIFNEILIEIHTFSFKKIHFKMSSGKWWPFCLCLNVLIYHWMPLSTVVTNQYTIVSRNQSQSRFCSLNETLMDITCFNKFMAIISLHFHHMVWQHICQDICKNVPYLLVIWSRTFYEIRNDQSIMKWSLFFLCWSFSIIYVEV